MICLTVRPKYKKWVAVLLIAATCSLVSCTSYVKKYEKNWLTDELSILSASENQKLKAIHDSLLQKKGIVLWVVIKDTVSSHFPLPKLHIFFIDWHPDIKQEIPWYDRYIFFKSEKDKTLLLYIQKEPKLFYSILGMDLKDSHFESDVHKLILNFNKNENVSAETILKLARSIDEIEYRKPSWLVSNFLADTFREAWDFRFFGAYLFDAYLFVVNLVAVILDYSNFSLIFVIIMFTFLFSVVATRFEHFGEKSKTHSEALNDLGYEIGTKIGILGFAFVVKNPGIIPFAFATGNPSFYSAIILMPIICLIDIVLSNNIAGLMTIDNTSHFLKSSSLRFFQDNSFSELFSDRFFGTESSLIMFLFFLHSVIVISFLLLKLSDKKRILTFAVLEFFGFGLYLLLFYLPSRFLPVSFSLAFAIPMIFHLHRVKSFTDISKSILSNNETRRLVKFSQRLLLGSLLPMFIIFRLFLK